jgi:hypothetical protein
MTKSLPNKLLVIVSSVAVCLGLVVGLVADLGAGGPWLWAAVAVGLSVGVVLALARGRDLVVAEGLCVLLIGTVAWLVARDADLSHKVERLQAQANVRADRPKTYDFVVFAGEPDPRPDSVGGSVGEDTMAFERFDPATDAAVAHATPHDVGEHVQVRCHAEKLPSDYIDRVWFRLTDGNFMHDGVIKQAAHSGQAQPPSCP